jgi:hypothetical protein
MRKKLSIIGLIVISIGLLTFSMANRITAAADSGQDVNARISKLEKQVVDMQKQIKDLEYKANYRTIAIPNSQVSPGSKMPPGTIQREFNGLKYWVMPINESNPKTQKPVN